MRCNAVEALDNSAVWLWCTLDGQERKDERLRSGRRGLLVPRGARSLRCRGDLRDSRRVREAPPNAQGGTHAGAVAAEERRAVDNDRRP